MSATNSNYSLISVDKYFIAITVVYIALFYYFFSTNPTGEDQPGWSGSNSFFFSYCKYNPNSPNQTSEMEDIDMIGFNRYLDDYVRQQRNGETNTFPKFMAEKKALMEKDSDEDFTAFVNRHISKTKSKNPKLNEEKIRSDALKDKDNLWKQYTDENHQLFLQEYEKAKDQEIIDKLEKNDNEKMDELKTEYIAIARNKQGGTLSFRDYVISQNPTWTPEQITEVINNNRQQLWDEYIKNAIGFQSYLRTYLPMLGINYDAPNSPEKQQMTEELWKKYLDDSEFYRNSQSKFLEQGNYFSYLRQSFASKCNYVLRQPYLRAISLLLFLFGLFINLMMVYYIRYENRANLHINTVSFKQMFNFIGKVFTVAIGALLAALILLYVCNYILQWSLASNALLFVFNLANIIVLLALVYIYFVSKIKWGEKPKTFYHLMKNIVFFIPCLLIDAIGFVMGEYRNTQRVTYTLLGAEALFITGYFVIPMIISYLVNKYAHVLLDKPTYLKKQHTIGIFQDENERLERMKKQRDLQNSGSIYARMVRLYHKYVSGKPNPYPEFTYNYAVSFWLYINPQPVSVHNTRNFVSVFNYNNMPNILYRANDNTLKITMKVPQKTAKMVKTATECETKQCNKYPGEKDSVTAICPYGSPGAEKETLYCINETWRSNLANVKTIYETNDFKLQKWNNILINYDGGTLDIFINDELISSTPNIVAGVSSGNITIGSPEGVHGGINNIVYFDRVLDRREISLLYKSSNL